VKTIKRNGDKIITNSEKVSCICCCFVNSCDDVTIPTFEELYDYFKYSGGSAGTTTIYGTDADNPPIASRFRRSKACLRFYYRAVNEYKGPNGTVFCQGFIGPNGVTNGTVAATTAFGTREDKSNLINGESCGLYIYTIYFFYWSSGCTSDEYFAGVGGSQYIEDEGCSHIRVYNVDMYGINQYLWS